MQIQVKVDANSLHHYVDVPVVDAEGTPTGETKEVLQIDFRCPDYSKLPTYGITVDMPVTKEQVKDAIETKVQGIKAQMDRDATIRSSLGTDILEFTVEA